MTETDGDRAPRVIGIGIGWEVEAAVPENTTRWHHYTKKQFKLTFFVKEIISFWVTPQKMVYPYSKIKKFSEDSH